VLGLLRERGIEPEITEYLKTPPTRTQLTELIRRSGLSVRDFLRTREKLYGNWISPIRSGQTTNSSTFSPIIRRS